MDFLVLITLVQYSNKFMYGIVQFLIVLLCSLLCFVQYCCLKSIQCNAMHKFVGVLDNLHFNVKAWRENNKYLFPLFISGNV